MFINQTVSKCEITITYGTDVKYSCGKVFQYTKLYYYEKAFAAIQIVKCLEVVAFL